MDTQKITNPYAIADKYRNAIVFRDSLDRYSMRRDEMQIQPWQRPEPTFETYELKTHKLLASGTFGSRKGIGRVLHSKKLASYLVGIELETEGLCCDSSDDEKIENVSDILQRFLPKNHVCVYDGSLRNGIEIVTAPLAPDEITRIGWYGLLRQLSRAGLTSHDSGRCGLHVSISRKYLSEENWRRLRAFITRHRAFFEAISRREGKLGFCEFRNANTKYTALNLSKGNVAEFRFFRGTLKPASFIASVEIVRALVEWVKTLQNDNKTRFSSASFLRFLNASRFHVARAYVENHTTLLRLQRATTSNPRPRRSNDEIRNDALRVLGQRLNRYSYQLASYDENGLTITLRNRVLIADNVSIEYNENPTTTELQIDYSRCLLPRDVRVAQRRGLLPSSIRVVSNYAVNPSSRVVFRYQRGGWGRGSYLTARVVNG